MSLYFERNTKFCKTSHRKRKVTHINFFYLFYSFRASDIVASISHFNGIFSRYFGKVAGFQPFLFCLFDSSFVLLSLTSSKVDIFFFEDESFAEVSIARSCTFCTPNLDSELLVSMVLSPNAIVESWKKQEMYGKLLWTATIPFALRTILSNWTRRNSREESGYNHDDSIFKMPCFLDIRLSLHYKYNCLRDYFYSVLRNKFASLKKMDSYIKSRYVLKNVSHRWKGMVRAQHSDTYIQKQSKRTM